MCRERVTGEGDSIVSRMPAADPCIGRVFHRENWKGDSWDGDGASKGR